MNDKKETRVLILGGGFGGVACALKLAELNHPLVKARLVSDKPHFEYHGALYRLVTGRSPLEICMPLREIFNGRDVELVEDRVVEVNLKKKVVRGESDSIYGYDVLVMALGSETVYYDTPGLEKLAYGFKSIAEALKLKRHLHQLVGMVAREKDKQEQVSGGRIVVVGGGASGTELAGELAVYLRKLAKGHGVDPTLLSIDLVQSPNRLLPDLPEEMGKRIEEKLRSLGVNVYVNRRVVKEEVEKVYLKDMEMRAKTLVWTAGVMGNRLYGETKGLVIDKGGRVEVTTSMRAKGWKRVYVVGDGAATRWGGMAQTALGDGKLVAENIVRKVGGEKLLKRANQKPIYAIPVGPGWAAVLIGERQYYGVVGWMLRRWLDWKVFTSLLPVGKAWTAFREGGVLSEQCEVCARATSD